MKKHGVATLCAATLALASTAFIVGAPVLARASVPSAPAQENADADEGEGTRGVLAALPPPTFSSSFERLWKRYRDARASGQTELMARTLSEIQRLRVERNAFELHDVSMAMAFEGAQYLARGDAGGAKESFQNAHGLDPSLPAPLFGLAQVAKASGGFWPAGYLGYTAQAYLASFRSVWNGYYSRASFLIMVVLSAFIALSIFAALMLYRYLILLEHDFSEKFEKSFGRLSVRFLTLLTILLPLVMTFGAGWLVPYWLVLTFAYQNVKERAVSVAALVFILVVPPLIEVHGLWSSTVANPLFRASISSHTGRFKMRDVATLREGVLQYPEDTELKIILGTQYKNLGEYDLAAAVYREVLQRDGQHAAAQVNLGNIYFAQRDWEGAILQYTSAIRATPDLALAYYNKSVAHGENFEFKEQEQALQRAENLDRAAVASFEAKTGDVRAVADTRPSPSNILRKFLGRVEGIHSEPGPSLWSKDVLIGGRAAAMSIGALVLAALLLALEFGAPQRRDTQRCRKCGSAFCARCQIGTGRRGLCTQCYHLFVVKDGVSAAARNQKLEQVSQDVRVRRTVCRLLSIVMPGGGHIAEEQGFVGIALLFVWLSGIVFLVGRNVLYPSIDPTLGLESSLHEYTVIAVMAVVLLAANTMAQPKVRA